MLQKTFYNRAVYKRFCTLVNSSPSEQHMILDYKIQPNNHENRIKCYFNSETHLQDVKSNIPERYLGLKRTNVNSLYLVDSKIANRVCRLIVPFLKQNKNQVICETNAGLGLITEELLSSGVKFVRIYESCPDFRTSLKNLCTKYRRRVELFKGDLFTLHLLSYIDKKERACRVDSILQGIDRRDWADKPVMSIIGAVNDLTFIKYLLRSVCLQSGIASRGRADLYLFMRARDYVILMASPELKSHLKPISILFQMFCENEILDSCSRLAFLPWQITKEKKSKRYYDKVNPDLMYFVRISFKSTLPVRSEHLLYLYTFITQVYRRGGKAMIPALEHYMPGCGVDILTSNDLTDDDSETIGIFTKFGELDPKQILQIFNIVINQSQFGSSPFASLSESQMIKSETIETDLNECELKGDVQDPEDLIEKF